MGKDKGNFVWATTSVTSKGVGAAPASLTGSRIGRTA